MGKRLELDTWTLNQVLDKKVNSWQLQSDEKLQDILHTKTYKKSNDSVVTFQAPHKTDEYK